MKPEIKNISSSDIIDLENWIPSNLESVYFPLTLTIGYPSDVGGDQFQILVTTPEAIRARPYLGICILVRHWMIVKEYNWKEIFSEIEKYVAQCEGDTWNDTAYLLSRYFYWEFEDYKDMS